MIALLLACASSRWTPEAALAPALARLDTDHDGRVEADEWARVADRGAAFAQADEDGDGAVDLDELAAVNRAWDPLAWSASTGIVGPPAAGKAAPQKARPLPPERFAVYAILEDLRAKDPALALPDEARVEAALAAGPLRSPEARALLAELEAASARAGLDFPAPLRAENVK